MKINTDIYNNYFSIKELNLFGRYITLNKILPILKSYETIFTVKIIGYSFLKKPIYSVNLGTGKIKILIWTQMHGNESTGTKAVFDLLRLFANPQKDVHLINHILSICTIVIIPILNPDGAEKYTRVNAQNIDLNRDAVNLKAPESKALRYVLDSFKPNYCFNLHDQRTIFSVGKENNPATLSFLAPSVDKKRSVTKSRINTMEVITTMFLGLKDYIPNQIGRYTDEFYPKATGDNFQKEGYPTILIEAGHYKDDYVREKTRKYNFIALFVGLQHIASDKIITKNYYETYFKIPNNEKKYYDLIFTNILLNNSKIILGITYKEELIDTHISFIPQYTFLDDDSNYNCNNLINKEIRLNSENEIPKILLKFNLILN